MNRKKWKIPYARPEYPEELRQAGYGPLLSAVLALRGVRSAGEAQAMLHGGPETLHDPLLMADMGKARDRLLEAIRTGETVAVFGDYDVDGITATCLLTEYLRSKGLRCHPYIPDRSGEGYGLNKGALKSLREKGVSLVVTVDCGITAVEEALYARELGLDLVITDHHECGKALPEAVAVVDCCREDDRYPNKDLAGVGVALKLVCACEGDQLAVLDKFADLAAIGTVADVMPLVDENRYLVRRGLEMMSRPTRPGLAAMFRETSVNPEKLTASTLSFSLAPRLNAAGRLGSPDIAARLLLSRDETEAGELAARLCALNRQRQEIELDIWRQAQALIPEQGPEGPIVLASEGWHQGVIGIAASRLTEQYSLPAVMICLSEGLGKGSCRSCGEFNLYEALSACAEHLLGFGGHALAAGLSIRADKVEDFSRALAAYYKENKPKEPPCLSGDLLVGDASLLTLEEVRSLDLLEPYGSANPRPVLFLSGVELDAATAVGNGRHLRLRVRLGRDCLEGIFFSHTASELGIRPGDRIDLAFTPQVNEFRGRESVQLLVSAARPHDGTALCRQILAGDESVLWAAGCCPERADFVRIWRGLDQDFAVAGDAEGVIAQCPPGMDPERFCICLLAFWQAGLLQGPGEGVYGAKPAVIEGKADLEATPVMRSLRAL